VAPQIDIFVGGYFNYTFNDVNKSDKHPLGWGGEDYAFMHKYDGAYATDLAGKSHPWQVGVKVGVHWRHIAKPKTVHIDYYDHFTRLDTLVTLLERVDTVSTQHSDTFFTPIKHAARMVEKFNKIYFDFDSSVLNEESKNYLRSINDVLAHTSDSVRISIQGHASKEGLKKHNEALARRRAQRVAEYLVEQGLDRKRIEVRGFGSSVENDENVNHTLNMDRRVEVKVILGEGANKYSNQIEYEK
jgi:outer membrane protein OmpA-like peptidoglycan-associated protein